MVEYSRNGKKVRVAEEDEIRSRGQQRPNPASLEGYGEGLVFIDVI